MPASANSCGVPAPMSSPRDAPPCARLTVPPRPCAPQMALFASLRIISLDLIDEVGAWRDTRGVPDARWMWGGADYLAKMRSDVSFLAESKAIAAWAVFPLSRNPFIYPMGEQPTASSADHIGLKYTPHVCAADVHRIRDAVRVIFNEVKQRPGALADGDLPTDADAWASTPDSESLRLSPDIRRSPRVGHQPHWHQPAQLPLSEQIRRQKLGEPQRFRILP